MLGPLALVTTLTLVVVIITLVVRLRNYRQTCVRALTLIEENKREAAKLREEIFRTRHTIASQKAEMLVFREIASILGQNYKFELAAQSAFSRMLELLSIDFGMLVLEDEGRNPVRFCCGISEENLKVLDNVADCRLVLEETPPPFRPFVFEEFQKSRALQTMRDIPTVVDFACKVRLKRIGFFTVGFHKPRNLQPPEADALQFCADQFATAYEVSKRLTGILELEELRKDYISTVSHELRTPLSTIYGYLNILRSYPEEMLQGQEKAEMFSVMTDECHRLIRLINNLLLSAQLEQEDFAQKLTFEPVFLSQVVSQALRFMERGLKKKEIRVVTDLPPDIPPINGNSDLLYQVFHNLIANSIKFAGGDPTIEIAGREDGEAVVISLSDNGIGIDERDLPNIFQKFYRSNGQAGKHPGLGIGLYLVHRLVELHAGSIQVTSQLNRGTTFILKFPQAAQNSSLVREARA